MTYSNKQALKLAAKFETKYGNKKINKTAGNAQAVIGLMNSYGGTADFLQDVAEADAHMWSEVIDSLEDDEQEHAKALSAASKTKTIIMSAARAINDIESEFQQVTK